MPTDDPGSVTRWIGALKNGEQAAAQPLWERYFQRLVRRAPTEAVERRTADRMASVGQWRPGDPTAPRVHGL